MTAPNGINLVYGTFGFTERLAENTTAEAFHAYSKRVFEVLKEEEVLILDTAETYTGSEDEIAYNHGADHFIIHTKIRGGFGKARTSNEIIAAGRARLKALKTTQVDVLYFHAPETTVSFKEQLAAVDVLYREGVFKRLGLSNYTAEQVQEVYDIAKSNCYVLPTVFQGNYAAVSRRPEDELIPKLRELGIVYYVYSPIAGGFLAKTREQVLGKEGRFNSANSIGQLYNALYNKPSYLDALDKWGKIAEDAGISKAELAYRWVVYHSALDGSKGDGITFGARTPEQAKETIGYIKAGPLALPIAKRVDGLWDGIKHEAPVDNYHG